MFENAKLEHMLREKLCNNMKDARYIKEVEEKEYRWLIKEFFNRLRFDIRKKSERKSLKESWIELANKRNLLAHSEEKFDSEGGRGYYIYSKDYHTEKELYMYEDSLDDERRYISGLVPKLIKLLNGEFLQQPKK